MRIIAGKARGRAINAPAGMETRPVTDIIRESLFNIWQFQVEGCEFLDLFSGSGCMGLEALSRGAGLAVMVDSSPEAVRTIRANLARTGLDACRNEVVKADVIDLVGRYRRTHRSFDIVYVDPPFTQPELFRPVLDALSDGALLKEGGVIAIRTRREMRLPYKAGELEEAREKRYGISTVHFYQVGPLWEEDEDDEDDGPADGSLADVAPEMGSERPGEG